MPVLNNLYRRAVSAQNICRNGASLRSGTNTPMQTTLLDRTILLSARSSTRSTGGQQHPLKHTICSSLMTEHLQTNPQQSMAEYTISMAQL